MDWNLFFSAFGGMCAALGFSVPVLRYIIRTDATATTKEVLNGIKDRLVKLEVRHEETTRRIAELHDKGYDDISRILNGMMKMDYERTKELMEILKQER